MPNLQEYIDLRDIENVNIGEYITIGEANQTYEISIFTLHQWLNSGKLKTYWLGRKLIHVPELEAFLNARDIFKGEG